MVKLDVNCFNIYKEIKVVFWSGGVGFFVDVFLVFFKGDS